MGKTIAMMEEDRFYEGKLNLDVIGALFAWND